MNKLRVIFTLITFLIALYPPVKAQMDVVVSGGEASGSGGTSSYSVGQVNYINIPAEAGFISLGVQQPNLFLTVDTDEPEINVSASAFPNPAHHTVNLELDIEQQNVFATKELHYELYDTEGKILMRQKIVSPLTSIPIDALGNALYFLRVTRDHHEIKTFKIFKSN